MKNRFDTSDLSEALMRDEITPMEYVRLRQQRIGSPNVLDNLIRPALDLLLRRTRERVKKSAKIHKSK